MEQPEGSLCLAKGLKKKFVHIWAKMQNPGPLLAGLGSLKCRLFGAYPRPCPHRSCAQNRLLRQTDSPHGLT